MIVADLAGLAAPVDRLELLPGNPRRGDVEAVARSLAAFGQRKPIVARRDGTVIAGNHTLQAARSLGWSEIAVVWVDDDDATAKAFALADNRTAELGGYDDAALADLIAEVQAADEALLAATGWSGDDLADLMAKLESQVEQVPQMVEDDGEVPQPPAKTVPGDVWLLGPHRVVCGDATEPSTVERALSGCRSYVAVIDPPYELRDDDWLPLLHDPSIVFGQARAIRRIPDEWWRFERVVHKGTGHRSATVQVLHQHAFVAQVGTDRVLPSDPTVTLPSVIDGSDRPDHPHQKPAALIVEHLTHWTPVGLDVFDPFAGSGSSLVAATQTGRVARLIELSPTYVDLICARFQKATGIVPIAESTGRPHDFLAEVANAEAPKRSKRRQ